eukprot:PhF_6_TR30719/c0_g1_i2/m.45206
MKWSFCCFVLFVSLVTSLAPFEEREALWSMYNVCNGPQWPQQHKEGWGTWDACTWSGIACDPFGHVSILDLEQDNMRCELPASLGNLSRLRMLDVSSHLIGTVPQCIRYWTMLEHLKLYENELTGTLPEWLSELRMLKEIAIVPVPPNKGLVGTIPDTLGELPLNTLVLDYNSLSGRVPEWIKNLPNYKLRGNKFSGPCPTPSWATAETIDLPKCMKIENRTWRRNLSAFWKADAKAQKRDNYHNRPLEIIFKLLLGAMVLMSGFAIAFYGMKWHQRRWYYGGM